MAVVLTLVQTQQIRTNIHKRNNTKNIVKAQRLKYKVRFFPLAIFLEFVHFADIWRKTSILLTFGVRLFDISLKVHISVFTSCGMLRHLDLLILTDVTRERIARVASVPQK